MGVVLRRAIFLVVVVACGVLSVSCNQGKAVDYSNATVIRIFDGDTVKLGTGEHVRFIGIDCPEMSESDKQYRQAEDWSLDIRIVEDMAREAASFTSNLLLGKQVRLEFDKERYDDYGRLLAYVYLPDGTFVNEALVKRGYAALLTIPPNNKYESRFKAAYEEALVNEFGLWGS